MTTTNASALVDRLNDVRNVLEALSGALSKTGLKSGGEGVDALSETMESVAAGISDVMPEYDMETSSSVDRKTGAMSFVLKGAAEGRGMDGELSLDPEAATLKGTFKTSCLKGAPSLAVSPEGCPDIVGAVLRAVKRLADMVDSYDVSVSYEQGLLSGDITASVRMDLAFMGRYAKSVEATFLRVDGRDSSSVKVLKRRAARASGAEGSEKAA